MKSPRGLITLRSQEMASLRSWAASWGVPNDSIAQMAHELGVPLQVVPDLSSSCAAQQVASLKPDVLIYAGGGIVGAPVLAAVHDCVLNGHSGPLPEVRGMAAAEWAVLTSSPIEVTVHRMTEAIDRGEVIERRAISPVPGTVGALRAAALATLAEVLIGVVSSLDLSPRDLHQPATGRTYFRLHPRLIPLVETTLQRMPASSPASTQGDQCIRREHLTEKNWT